MGIEEKFFISLLYVIVPMTNVYAKNNNEALVLHECIEHKKYQLEDFEPSDSCAKEFPLKLSLDFNPEKYTFLSFKEKIEVAKK